MTSSSSSIDDDLARVASQSLSMGPSIIASLGSSSCCILPSKRHPSLYNNSMKDISMNDEKCNTDNMQNKSSSEMGVPGFPDFPDCWQGETSGERNKNDDIDMGRADKKRMQKWKAKTNARINRYQQKQRLLRKAVNTSGITKTSAVGNGKEVKKRRRNDRRVRRMEQIRKLQERRKRKRDMGDICRGLASIKCK